MARQPLVILSEREIGKMREAGRLAAEILAKLGAMVEPGITTLDIDAEAARLIDEAGATAATVGYKGYEHSTCTSVNNEVCHGIPSAERVLNEGDIVCVDVTPRLNGYHGDTCRTFPVGHISDEAAELLQVTEECLERGIQAVASGRFLGDVGRAIADHAEAHDFSVVRDFVGHGIGAEFHAAPQVPHFRPTKRGMRLRPGMAFTIEPMINQGDWQVEVLADGWTAVTRDGSLSAQFEHTIVVTRTGAEVMTRPPS